MIGHALQRRDQEQPPLDLGSGEMRSTEERWRVPVRPHVCWSLWLSKTHVPRLRCCPSCSPFRHVFKRGESAIDESEIPARGEWNSMD
uniref:Uncharacterized protein n=1 Tax=Setaria italica TaxID=4555 RepID=K4AHA3_SETIT